MLKTLFKIFFILFVCVPSLSAQKIPSPEDYFGFKIGEDYKLVNYSQTAAYFKKLASVSNRVILKNIGPTEEGRTQYMAVISSPENLAHIEKYKEISQKLARAEISPEEADKLIGSGKPIIWIDGGIHSTETVGFMQLIKLYYALLSRQDSETLDILDRVVILLCQANPDGQELVANWYMRDNDPLKRKKNIPRLYNKYVGHDDNRDFYMMNLKETQNISRQLYVEWLPQIVYDHHQPGPSRGQVLAGPPYRDPFNYLYHPLIISGIDAIGSVMTNRLFEEGKPGYTRMTGSTFSTWWNGGLRNTTYFHNMIGILTELVGDPTPSKIPVVPSRLEPNMATPYPVWPQKWHFSQAIEYSISLNYSVLNYAARSGKILLKNIYLMGRDAIEKGSRDSWTFNPQWSDSLHQVYKRDNALVQYEKLFKDPLKRDPRGYIIPSNQPDFPTAVRFINSMIRSGIKVYKATGDFQVGGKNYPSGSYIIKTDQAFRPYVLDMFEPQHYPNQFQYEGGPPVPPYDAAGWTLADQMGIAFDRIRDGFTGPFEAIEYGRVQKIPAKTIPVSKEGYLLSAAVNHSFIIVNELLNAGVPVYRITTPSAGLPAGSFYIPSRSTAALRSAVVAAPMEIETIDKKPEQMIPVKPARVALYDRYRGYTAVGWTRWLMDQYHFKYHMIYPREIDEGNLSAKYDIILFIDNGIPTPGKQTASKAYESETVPKAYWYKLGRLSTTKSIPKLKEFVEKGGDIITVGAATRLAYHFDLPVTNALVDDKGKTLARSQYYVPTSILRILLNAKAAENWGMRDSAKVVFNNNPVFRLKENAQNVKVLATFGNGDPLVSGWAWGRSYLDNGIAAFSATMGKGRFYAFSPEVLFRGQSWGTFKLLFNELYLMNGR